MLALATLTVTPAIATRLRGSLYQYKLTGIFLLLLSVRFPWDIWALAEVSVHHFAVERGG